MTTSRERARDVVALLTRKLPGCGIYVVMADKSEAFNLIAQAIREAEDAALEKAEVAILNEHSVASSDDLNTGLLRAHRAVRAVKLARHLKSQEPSP